MIHEERVRETGIHEEFPLCIVHSQLPNNGILRTRRLARYACFFLARVENVTNGQTHIGGWVENVTNGRTEVCTGEDRGHTH